MSGKPLDLLERIASLRQRLARVQELAGEAANAPVPAAQPEPERLQRLRWHVGVERREQSLLHAALQSVPTAAVYDELPPHLTPSSARLLRQTKELLERLRALAADPILADMSHPATAYHQDCILLAELVVRIVQTMPEPVSRQVRLSSGADVLLGWLRQRVGVLGEMLAQAHAEAAQLDELARLLYQLRHGKLRDWNRFFALAEEIIQEAGDGRPLGFLARAADQPLAHVAAHSLTTARVIARAAQHDREWRTRLLQPVVAALVHDVGMLALPSDLLAHAGALGGEQRALVEKHCALGARWIAAVPPPQDWLVAAVRDHHERPDGLGYPGGKTLSQVEPLARLLAACDVYAALCTPRPQRAALAPRDALEQLSRLAEARALDRSCVRLVSRLSPTPVGSAVELDDGACGVVVATPAAEAKAAPVVLVLAGADGKPLPCPKSIDLSVCAGRAVRRTLSAQERRFAFGACYPQWT